MKLDNRIISLRNFCYKYHEREFVPREKCVLISTPQQVLAIDQTILGILLKDKAAIALGGFYESLAAAIHGGKPMKPIYLRFNYDLLNKFNGNGFGTNYNFSLSIEEEHETSSGDSEDLAARFESRPDIWDELTNTYRESKGLVLTNDCNLTYRQISGYKALQAVDQNKKINYVIHRHSLRGIKSRWKGTLNDLSEQLSNRTIYSLSLPFSIVLALYNYDNGNAKLVEYFDTPSSAAKDMPPLYTSIKDRVMDRLLLEPEKVMQELRLDPADYVIERYKTQNNYHLFLDIIPPNPPCFHTISSYPIIIIKDINHEKWAEKFMIEYLKELGVNDLPF